MAEKMSYDSMNISLTGKMGSSSSIYLPYPPYNKLMEHIKNQPFVPQEIQRSGYTL